MTATPAPSRTRAARLLGLLHRNADFRRLWTGETSARYGASVTSVALPLIAVTALHAGPFAVGLLTAASWLPWLLIGLPAGAWVDRLPKRPVMITAAAGSLLLYAGVPLAAALGALSFGHLLATALLTGTATVFLETASGVLLPKLLDDGDLAEGNAKLHGSESAAQLAGAATGGLVVQAAGAANALLVNSATLVAALLATGRIRHREPSAATTGPPAGPLRRQVAEGLRLAFRDPCLRALTVAGATSNLALMTYQAVLVVFLVRTAGLAPSAIGGLLAAGGAGGLLGAFAARRTAARIGSARALLLFELAVPSLGLLVPLTGNTPGGLACFLVGCPAISCGVVAGNVLISTFRQRYVPAELLGRAMTSARFLSFGAIPLGSLLGGALAQGLGLRAAVWIGVAGVPLSAAQLLFSPLRRGRDLPAAPPPPRPRARRVPAAGPPLHASLPDRQSAEAAWLLNRRTWG